MTWRIRHKTLHALSRGLKLKKPVRVEVRPWAGWHDERADCHLIVLADNLDADEANRVLLHELAHAAQAERNPDAYHARSHSHADDPLEQKADAFADATASIVRVVEPGD